MVRIENQEIENDIIVPVEERKGANVLPEGNLKQDI